MSSLCVLLLECVRLYEEVFILLPLVFNCVGRSLKRQLLRDVQRSFRALNLRCRGKGEKNEKINNKLPGAEPLRKCIELK